MSADADFELVSGDTISDVVIGDLDGDGVRDLAVSSVNACAVYLFSGSESLAATISSKSISQKAILNTSNLFL